MAQKTLLKGLLSWVNSYEKVSGEIPNKVLKKKIRELIESETPNETKSRPQIYFIDSKWSDYNTLRDELLKDSNFVKEYKGVDLQAYIEQAISWSEKGNKSTEVGWKLTLKNWMRKAKDEGKLIMKPIQAKTENKQQLFYNQ